MTKSVANDVVVSSGRWGARGRSMEVTVFSDDGETTSHFFSWEEWDFMDIRVRYGD
jgi:hypothetical protein